MTTTSWAALRDLLVDRYDEFRARLARRLGSAELANDTLQQTWLHLERSGDAGFLRSPEAYLFRVALNLAADQRDAEQRRLTLSEVELLLHLDVDELDPARIVEAQAEIAALAHLLREVSPRQRAIFFMARIEELPHAVIAERIGISTRMVERELRSALEYCGARLGRKVIKRFGPRPSEPSS